MSSPEGDQEFLEDLRNKDVNQLRDKIGEIQLRRQKRGEYRDSILNPS